MDQQQSFRAIYAAAPIAVFILLGSNTDAHARPIRTFTALNWTSATTEGVRTIAGASDFPNKESIQNDLAGRVVRREWKDAAGWHREHIFRYVDGSVASRGQMIYKKGWRPDGEWQYRPNNSDNLLPQTWTIAGDKGRSRPRKIFEATLISRDNQSADLSWDHNHRTTVTLDELGLTAQQADEHILAAKNVPRKNPATQTFKFDCGRLTHADGVPVKDFLWRVPDATRDSNEFIHCLEKIRCTSFTGSTNYEVHSSVPRNSDEFNIHMRYCKLLRTSDQVCVTAGREVDRGFDVLFSGPPLPHIATLYLILRQQDLVLDYRFRRLQIEPLESARKWKDTTNVDSLNLASGAKDFGGETQFYGAKTVSEAVEFLHQFASKDKQLTFQFEPEELGTTKHTATQLGYKMTINNVLGITLMEHGLSARREGNSVILSRSPMETQLEK